MIATAPVRVIGAMARRNRGRVSRSAITTRSPDSAIGMVSENLPIQPQPNPCQYFPPAIPGAVGELNTRLPLTILHTGSTVDAYRPGLPRARVGTWRPT